MGGEPILSCNWYDGKSQGSKEGSLSRVCGLTKRFTMQQSGQNWDAMSRNVVAPKVYKDNIACVGVARFRSRKVWDACNSLCQSNLH